MARIVRLLAFVLLRQGLATEVVDAAKADIIDVHVSLGDGKSLGISTVSRDGGKVISQVNDGLIEQWNQNHANTSTESGTRTIVEPGDIIITANGHDVSEDPKKKLVAYANSGNIHLQIKKQEPEEPEEQEPEEPIPVEQLRALHSKLDANGDGKVDMQELHAANLVATRAEFLTELKSGEFLKGNDENKDGKLSVSEMGGGDEQMMAIAAAADLDRDGFLTTEEELMAVLHPSGNPATLAVETEHAFKDIDTDNSGNISKAEHDVHQANAPFEAIDANGDGAIDVEEYAYLMSNKAYEDLLFMELMSTLDEDGDAHVSAQEFEKASPKTELMAYQTLGFLVEHHEL